MAAYFIFVHKVLDAYRRAVPRGPFRLPDAALANVARVEAKLAARQTSGAESPDG